MCANLDQAMAHAHAHAHPHSHARPAAGSRARPFVLTLALVTGYMVLEVIGGFVSGSLALLADAGHMLSDAGALALTIVAMHFARRPPSSRSTFGYYRAEILAALVNGATLLAIAVGIVWEAYHRFAEPHDVRAGLMLAVAAGGLVVNLAGLWILHDTREEGLNERGAWLHVLTDALGSVQAIGAAGLIWLFDWEWADPLASVLIAALVVYSAWSLLAQATAVLMEAAPGHIAVDEVRDALLGHAGVLEVHDLHVWSISSGFVALSAHLVVGNTHDADALLRSARAMVKDRFHIQHTTLQLEREHPCEPDGRHA
jgi:cobalt-zinc-cadmium efflux system protein